jgi:quercetin dioxygenase-like cupin family protein
MHYHEDTEHFFYVLEGEGVIEIEGDEHEISEGSVVWVGEGDEHRLYAREDQDGMRLFEFFSNADRETVYTSGKACTWTPESV